MSVTELRPKPKRKQISTRTRFEIFKRDGFRCHYCGANPLQKQLRCDHVVPVAEGGGSGESNLITSCFDCNAGKAGVLLEKKRFSKTIATEADRDHAAQIREYLEIQRGIEHAKELAQWQFYEKAWHPNLGPMSEEMFARLDYLLGKWPYEALIEATKITARKFGRLETYEYRGATNRAKYFHGVLRKMAERAAEEVA